MNDSPLTAFSRIMQGNPLRLAEGRILAEQLRLLLRNVASALIPTFFLSILLA